MLCITRQNGIALVIPLKLEWLLGIKSNTTLDYLLDACYMMILSKGKLKARVSISLQFMRLFSPSLLKVEGA